MLDLFKATLISYLDGKTSSRLLLAVSGGLDSMVMLDMLRRCDFPIIVAHVDHNTRNGQSAKDARFVEKYCIENELEYFSAKINNEDLVGKNFQSEARNFRYSYFRNLATELNVKYILTAHHKDDRWETMLYNLSKAAGLDGLSTLRYKDGDLLRPMLVFTRSQIEDYAKKQNIAFVHDVSNDATKYTRNKIRHSITPAVTEVFPDMINSAALSARYLNQVKELLEELLDKEQFWNIKGKYVIIDLKK